MTNRTIRWAKLHPLGNLLPPAYAGDGGFDLVAVENIDIGPSKHGQGVVQVPCGIRLALPDDVNALVIGRSNTILGGLLVVNTLIDAGYRGPMFIFVINLNPIMTAHIQAGTRLAQLLLMPLLATQTALLQIGEDEPLPPSERGSRAFGSSGGVHSSISLLPSSAPASAPDPDLFVLGHVYGLTNRGGLQGPEELPGS